MGIQEVDIISMVSSITKYANCITHAGDIKYQLQKASYLANSGRKGPVWLDIPLNVQGAIVDELNLREFTPEKTEIDTANLTKISDEIINALNNAEKPVILVGNGVRTSNSIDQFLMLINKLKIPVLTTWKTSDFLSEDHHLYCGRPGIIASRGANFTQQYSDCLLILGARLDLCQTGFNHPNFAKNAKKIIIDIDENEINKLNMDFHLKYVSDVGLVIEQLNNCIIDTNLTNHDNWLNKCKNWQKEIPCNFT